MRPSFAPVSGTAKETRHPGLHLFGWCFTCSFQSRHNDLNPFAKMNWRNFDIGIGIEKSTYTGGAIEANLSLLLFAVFFECYRMSGREAFAAPMNELRDQIKADRDAGMTDEEALRKNGCTPLDEVLADIEKDDQTPSP